MSQFVVIDIESKRLANEVGGWNHIDKMGFAVGVIFDVNADSFIRFTEKETDRLIDLLKQADQVVGFNLIRFDYTVLRPYGFQVTEEIRAKTVDLLQDIYNALGFRVSLNNVAVATLLEAKTADGLAAVKWFRQGDVEKVFEYCEQDVLVTYKIWQFGATHAYVNYSDRRGNIKQVHVKWTLPSPPSDH